MQQKPVVALLLPHSYFTCCIHIWNNAFCLWLCAFCSSSSSILAKYSKYSKIQRNTFLPCYWRKKCLLVVVVLFLTITTERSRRRQHWQLQQQPQLGILLLQEEVAALALLLLLQLLSRHKTPILAAWAQREGWKGQKAGLQRPKDCAHSSYYTLLLFALLLLYLTAQYYCTTTTLCTPGRKLRKTIRLSFSWSPPVLLFAPPQRDTREDFGAPRERIVHCGARAAEASSLEVVMPRHVHNGIHHPQRILKNVSRSHFRNIYQMTIANW